MSEKLNKEINARNTEEEKPMEETLILESLIKSFATDLVPVLEELREAEKEQIQSTKNTWVD